MCPRRPFDWCVSGAYLHLPTYEQLLLTRTHLNFLFVLMINPDHVAVMLQVFVGPVRPWISNCGSLFIPQRPEPHQNASDNLRCGCRHCACVPRLESAPNILPSSAQ